MNRRLVALCAAVSLALSAYSSSAYGQAEPAYRPGGATTDTNPLPVKVRCWNGSAWAGCGSGVQESFQLALANAAAPAVTVYGGDYILSQTCTGYGTVTLQARGPDGSSYLTLLTKSASDTGAAGTGLALGSYANVRVVLTGTTGCNIILSRVPA